MAKLIAACLALAGISLLLPAELSYDPWAWLVWGREIAHGGLDTTGGPSWKPLPVVFTTLVARLEEVDEGLPAALWIVVARAGALLALAMAFRLASRLAGGGLVGAVGGAVAATGLFLAPDWFQFSAHGSEAPIAVALMLWAIERRLDGHHAQVVVLGTLACLLGPELPRSSRPTAWGRGAGSRALDTRLAWELGVPIDRVERVTDHRVVFRSLRERLSGRVYMLGAAASRRTLARVGGIWVYRRDGLRFPLARREFEAIGSAFTATLQGIHTSTEGEGTSAPG